MLRFRCQQNGFRSGMPVLLSSDPSLSQLVVKIVFSLTKCPQKKSVLGYVPCSQVMHYFPNLELLATCSQYQVIHLLHTFYFLARPPSYLLSLNIFGIHHLPDFNFWVYSEVIHNLHDFNFLALLTSNLLFAQFWSLGWLSSDPSFAQINFVTRFQSSFPSCLNAEKRKIIIRRCFMIF